MLVLLLLLRHAPICSWGDSMSHSLCCSGIAYQGSGCSICDRCAAIVPDKGVYAFSLSGLIYYHRLFKFSGGPCQCMTHSFDVIQQPHSRTAKKACVPGSASAPSPFQTCQSGDDDA